MKSLFLLVSNLLFLSSLSAQTISGKVSDDKQKPLAFASVLLLSRDSSMLKSILTDDFGIYKFNTISPGKYIISITAVGYKKTLAPITVSVADLTVPEINLLSDGKVLGQVNITAKKPFLEQRPDKLVVNVESSATAAGSTALEILQKVPGLIVSSDKITMVGKGSPIILIDGRTSQYTDITQVLKDMSAANIDKIEVIGNPGAKYDAAGGAVINIILKRNANLGTNGNVSFSSGMGLYNRSTDHVDRNFYRMSPSVTLNHRKGKINTFGNYSYFDRNQYERLILTKVIDGVRSTQENYTPNDASSHNLRAGIDFYADKKNTFGLILRGFFRDGLREASNNTNQYNDGSNIFINSFQTQNNTNSKRNNLSGNINWKHAFDSAGKDLNIDLDYSDFRIQNNSIIYTTDGSRNYINTQTIDNPVQFAVLKADYTHPFSKNTILEAGAKSSFATIDNFLIFRNSGVLNPGRSTDFRYKENVNAIYSSFQNKFGRWELKGGLRAEQTIANGEQESATVLKRSYVQLFPSMFVTRGITPKLSAVAQYSRRVNRPSFQQQNPFIEYLDSTTYTQGNPKLRPETSNQYKLSLTYQNQPFFALSYNVKNDVIYDNAPKQDGNFTYTLAENLGVYENFAAELNFPLNIGKKISGYGGNQFIYNKYKADYLASTYQQSRWNWLAYWQVAYKPVESLNFEVSGYYMTRFLNEFLIIDNLGSLNLAVQKTFLNKKARLSLNVSDILFSDNTDAVIKYQEVNVNFKQFYDSRNVRLTLSYSFGNQKLAATRNRKTASEDETNRVKDK